MMKGNISNGHAMFPVCRMVDDCRFCARTLPRSAISPVWSS